MFSRSLSQLNWLYIARLIFHQNLVIYFLFLVEYSFSIRFRLRVIAKCAQYLISRHSVTGASRELRFANLIYKRLYVVSCCTSLTVSWAFSFLFPLSLCDHDGCYHGVISFISRLPSMLVSIDLLGCYCSLYLPFYCCSTIEVQELFALA